MNQDPAAARNANAQPDEPNGNDAVADDDDAAAAAALIDEDGVEALEDDIDL